MTIEEIKKKAKEDNNLRKQLVIWATNETDEGKEILNNFAKAEVEKKIKDKTSELYTNIDNDIFEVLGIRKKNDQKTYDFIKELAKELKELRSKKSKTDESQKVKELEERIKKMQENGSVNEHWKKIYDEAVEKWQKERGELIEKINSKEKEYLEAQVLADLNSGISSLKIKDGIPKEAVDAMIKVHREEILKNAKLVDGKVVYHKPDGSPLLNKEYKPITSEEIWKEKLGALIDNDTRTKGGSADTNFVSGKIIKTGEGDNATQKLVLDKSKFSTKVEFQKLAESVLRKKGIPVGSKDYEDLLLTAYKEYEVDALELQ